jgi:hypothetical protein
LLLLFAVAVAVAIAVAVAVVVAVAVAVAVVVASRYPKALALGLSSRADRRITALPKAGAKRSD